MEALMVAWILVNIFALFTAPIALDNEIGCLFNPITIYKRIKVNWFGASLLTILTNVLVPALSVPYWIYKLCTVGRK